MRATGSTKPVCIANPRLTHLWLPHRLAGVMADTMGMGHDDLNGDDFEDFEGTNVPERSPSSSEAALDSTPRGVKWQHCGRLACLRKYA